MKQLTNQNQNFLTNGEKLDSAFRLATAFFKSKTFNQTISNEYQALTVLIAGNEAGLQPIESMNSFYMVKGSLVMYGSALSKVISRAGIDIKFLERSKTKIKVQYSKNDEVVDTLEYSIQDLPSQSKAKGFAPEEKLVYHAHSRFLRYNDVGASVPYTDYDNEVIEANEEKNNTVIETKENQTKTALIEFIKNEAESEEILKSVEKQVEQLKDEEIKKIYTQELEKFKK